MKNSVMCLLILLVLTAVQSGFGQSDEFYQTATLKYDYKQVDAVVYVNVTGLKIVDSIGSGDCETNKGSGYCLYELTTQVKEVFKGKAIGKTLKFYTSSDTDYPKKNLLGERVVFLDKGELDITKTKEFFTLENSTRRVEFGIVGKLRKIKKSVR